MARQCPVEVVELGDDAARGDRAHIEYVDEIAELLVHRGADVGGAGPVMPARGDLLERQRDQHAEDDDHHFPRELATRSAHFRNSERHPPSP
jgi:hypothetical protein